MSRPDLQIAADDSDTPPSFEQFLKRFWADRESGVEHPLSWYLERFDGADDAIAAEYDAVHAVGDAPTVPSPAEIATAGPKKIGPYLLGPQIGSGGQGVVYLAMDERLGRRAAVKLLRGLDGATPEVRLRFDREARIGSRVSHPGICTVYDTGVVDGTQYLAMEYVEGISLSRLLARWRVPPPDEAETRVPGDDAVTASDRLVDRHATDGPLFCSRTLREVVMLFIEAARALHVVHEAGIVHRDVKPGNMMITRAGHPKILDFGLARLRTADLPTLTRSGDHFGSPPYMSPEQVSQLGKEADRRTDIWSLGVSLYEALTLQRPFVAPQTQQLYRQIQFRAPLDPRALNPHVSRDLSLVILTAMEKEPDRRYRTGHDFAEDLRRVLAGEPILARPVPGWVRLLRWGRRKPALAGSLASAFLFLVAGLFVSLNLLADTRAERDAKNEALRQYEQMADAALWEDLRREVDELWPRLPEKLAAFDAWLRDARGLQARRAELTVAVKRLADEDLAGLTERELRAQRHRRRVLTQLVADLEELPEVIRRIEARRRFAADLERRSVTDEANGWARCLEDLETDPRFEGLPLRRRLGLVPLGRDARSRLWEFWVVGTGKRPEWTGSLLRGRIAPSNDMGVVLVLVPGGEFLLGSGYQSDKSRPKFRPVARKVGAFLMGKYEVTQHQWHHIMRVNPSRYPPSKDRVTPQNPIETVSWHDFRVFAMRHALQLPSSLQWEWACRGGKRDGVFWWGDAAFGPQAIAENLLDLTASQRLGKETKLKIADGFIRHAPVGRFLANSFGLHDMSGNVSEWTGSLTPKSPHDFTEAAFTGDGSVAEAVVYRGSNHQIGDDRFCRCGAWFSMSPRNKSGAVGGRLAASW